MARETIQLEMNRHLRQNNHKKGKGAGSGQTAPAGGGGGSNYLPLK